MCCQTQSTIIPLAEKHSLFSLMQFTHCHFTAMMSQAGDASSPLFHALLLSRDDVWAAPGCSRLSLLRGTATGKSFMGLRAGKSPLVPADGSGFLHAGSVPVPLSICPLARGRVCPRVVVTTLGCPGDAACSGAPQAKPEPSRQPCCCCYCSVSGFFQHRHCFSRCCHNNWR